MNREQLKSAIAGLAQSQGFYGRLLRNITEEGWQELEDQHFTDTLALIMYLEG